MLVKPAQRTPDQQALGAFLAVLVLVEVFSGVIQVYFSPIYGALARKFDVSVGTLSWSLTAFALATAVSTPVFAKLGDVYGHRRILRIEVAIVATGSVLIAVAPNFQVLIAGRILQGAFAAYLPLMFGLVRSRYSHEDTRRSVSYLTSVLIFGLLAGTVLVGVIVKFTTGATWALWLPAIGTLVGFAGLMLVRGEKFDRDPTLRVDWIGAVTLAIGLVLVLLGLSEGPTWHWASGRVIGCLVVGALVLAGWAVLQTSIEQPLADLRFLFRPIVLPIYLVGFAAFFGVDGGQVVVGTFMATPSKLGYGLGLDSFHIALWLPIAFAFMFVGVLSTARLGRTVGFRPVLVFGSLGTTLGFAGLAIWHASLTEFLVFYSLELLGIGLIESSTRTMVVDGLREGEVAMGEGVFELAVTIGGAIGSAVCGAVLSAHASALPGVASEAGYRTCWIVMGCVCAAAVLVAIGYVRSGRRRAQPDLVTSPVDVASLAEAETAAAAR